MRERTAILPGLPGTDVSHFQGTIDWAAVKNAGIQFAYLKASEGIDIQDPSFVANRAACKANNIPSGAYHFFRAKDPVPAQVDLFVKTLGQLGNLKLANCHLCWMSRSQVIGQRFLSRLGLRSSVSGSTA